MEDKDEKCPRKWDEKKKERMGKRTKRFNPSGSKSKLHEF